MGFFDRFKTSSDQPAAGASVDEQAIARYRYLLKTAPPEAIEQAHAEAFARLTPEQRQRLLSELASDMPDAERNAAYRAGEAPGALARVATRAELREPGAMERAWNRVGSVPGPGVGLGGMFAGSLLASMAGTVLGTVIGVAGAYAVSRLLIATIPTLPTRDPAALAGLTIALVAVALAACYLPAGRATRVDPLVALRHD